MNPDDLLEVNTLTLGQNGNVGIIAQDVASTFPTGTLTVSNAVMSSTVAPMTMKSEDVLDEYHMNRFAVDHKVTDQELIKLKEVAPDYAKEIKENIARNLARDISNKISYTKKHDKDTDVHHFIGRVWVFNEDELKAILERRNVY